MSGALAAWLQRRWYGPATPGMVLIGLAGLYAHVLRLRRWLYRRGLCRIHRLRVPVIVVGNLVVGGAGKTPVTIALASRLAAQGWRPGIVSRGYGRDSQVPVEVRPGVPAERCGDEPLLIARRTGLPVLVDSDRVAAARRLIAKGCNLILSDDGLQHCRLGRDIEIEVVDGERRHGNGRLLPAGPLREPAGRVVDFRIINGGAAQPDEWPMRLGCDVVQPLQGGTVQPLSHFAGMTVHAMAGIGHPGRFFAALRAVGVSVIEHPFPDHHAFQRHELQFQPPLPLLMTEKDAVKCAEFPLLDAWVVPVSADLPDAFFIQLADRLSEWTSAHAHA